MRVDVRLNAIVDPERAGGHRLVELAQQCAHGGATLVQLRDKLSPTRSMIEQARAIKQAGVFSAATYIVAALSLHLSNFLSTTNPVFDPHQFITDEWTAIAVALAVFGTLVMILTARNRP